MRFSDRGRRVLIVGALFVIKLDAAWTAIHGLACHKIVADAVETFELELFSGNCLFIEACLGREDVNLLLDDCFIVLG